MAGWTICIHIYTYEWHAGPSSNKNAAAWKSRRSWRSKKGRVTGGEEDEEEEAEEGRKVEKEEE